MVGMHYDDDDDDDCGGGISSFPFLDCILPGTVIGSGPYVDSSDAR